MTASILNAILKIGDLKNEKKSLRTVRLLQVYLAIFIGIGGIVWGIIAVYFGLYTRSLIPFGYTLVTCLNLYYFHSTRNFGVFRFIQNTISFVMPFLFQLALGGFESSGFIMIWSLIALTGSLSYDSKRKSVAWLFLFLGLVAVAWFFNDYAKINLKPDILEPFSLWFLILNTCTLASMIYIVVLFFVQELLKIRNSLSNSRNNLKEAISNLESTKEELEEKNIKLTEHNKLKSKFLATVSHEIRTPLNGIMGLTDLLSTTKLDNNQMNYVETLQKSNKILHRLVNDVLDLTQIESNKLSFSTSAFQLHDELSHILELLDVRFKQANNPKVDFKYLVSNDLKQIVKTDKTRLKQILINLINNAFKFTEEGLVEVIVESISESEETNQVKITIKDTGIGIPEEKQDSLFKEFYRIDELHKEGVGLGLSITRKIVDLMGGELDFTSVHKKGTTFTVILPLQVTNELAIKEEIPINIDDFKNLKILIAEDNEVNRLIVTKMLENNEINDFDFAFNGKEAVEKSKSDNYDLILMDINMPELTGVEATNEIFNYCKENDLPRPKIAALTANAMENEIKFYSDLGMSFVLNKPFTFNQLATNISKVITTSKLID
jgi:signal transduction histidine kinase/CheY-like chemotaxis protein